MNTRSSKRVVIINNLNSANIEQAIFILKGNEKSEDINTNLINEAQQIIDNYVKRLEKPNRENLYRLEQKRAKSLPNKKRKVKNKFPKLIIAGLSAIALLFAVYYANALITFI